MGDVEEVVGLIRTEQGGLGQLDLMVARDQTLLGREAVEEVVWVLLEELGLTYLAEMEKRL